MTLTFFVNLRKERILYCMVNIDLTNKLGTFKKVPKEIIYSSEKFNNNKRILLFLFLQYMIQTDVEDKKNFNFDLSYLLNWTSITPNRHRGGINDQFRSMLKSMETKNYIQKNSNSLGKFDNYYTNDDIFNPKENFGIVYNFEVDYILTAYKNKEILGKNAHYNLLLVLSYIRSNIKKISKIEYFNTDCHSNNPRTCWRHFTKMSEDLGLTTSTISECVDTLDKMGIIAHLHPKRKKFPNGVWINPPTIFADKYLFDNNLNLISHYSWEKEIANCKKLMKF